MVRKCRRCNSCKTIDGKFRCEKDGAEIDSSSTPRFDDGKCWTVRQKKTPEEISMLRSMAGKKGGMTPKKGKQKVPRTQMQVLRHDRDVIAAYAAKKKMTLIDTIHYFARYILQQHADIEKPEGWIE